MIKLDMGKTLEFLVSALIVTGCYNPNISPNGLHCATPPEKECPDGFACQGNVCVKSGSVLGGSGGAIGTGGGNASGGITGSGGTGGGTQPPKSVGETCLITDQGQPNQSDNCESGLLCMDDCAGSSSRCYKICENDADCSQSACTRVAPGGSPRLCEVPFMMCNPQIVGASACGTGLGCYLLSSDSSPGGGDRTVCDCSTGGGRMGDLCSDSRSCFPGLVCVPVDSGAAAGACRRICDPAAATSGCPAGTTCHPFGANWGDCS